MTRAARSDLTVVDAGPDALATLDTTDGIPVLEVACVHCDFSVPMVAYAPVSYAIDVARMAAAVIDRHQAADHPERVS